MRRRTILTEVLIEEFDRLKEKKQLYKASLKEEPKGSERWKHYKKRIRECNFDMWVIFRAMGPRISSDAKRFREDKKRYWDEYYRSGTQIYNEEEE